MNKKVKLVIFLIVIICLLSITATISFITRDITVNNVITFGNIKMQLMQTYIDENNIEKEVNSEVLDITHNSTLSRIVKIKNIGKHEFFARISLNVIGIDANNQEFDANDLISYNLNTEDWVYEDGWYYYKKIVKQDEITSELITEIKFSVNNITANYPKGKFKFNINAEAVQSQNNEENVLDVVGWPTK